MLNEAHSWSWRNQKWERAVNVMASFNPSIHKSDWLLISPYSITFEPYVKVMRIKKLITNLRSTWSSNKFSLSGLRIQEFNNQCNGKPRSQKLKDLHFPQSIIIRLTDIFASESVTNLFTSSAEASKSSPSMNCTLTAIFLADVLRLV